MSQLRGIDLFITNTPFFITLVDSIPRVSDHKIVTDQSTVHFCVIKQIPRCILCYSKANWDSISNELEDLQPVFNNIDPLYADTKMLWAMFCDKFSNLVAQ